MKYFDCDTVRPLAELLPELRVVLNVLGDNLISDSLSWI
jgi:hypothetical protein